MDENEQKRRPKEVCSIRIMFPVETDEQALDAKKKISEALSDISGVRIDFNLVTSPQTR